MPRPHLLAFRLDGGTRCVLYEAMKTKIFALLAATCMTILISGCVSTVDGRMRAGLPFGTDTIESRYDRPIDQIFAAAKDVLRFNGSLTGENTITKVLEARINTRTVWVKVDEVEPKITRVLVQARTKGGGADVALASEIDKQIALRLK